MTMPVSAHAAARTVEPHGEAGGLAGPLMLLLAALLGFTLLKQGTDFIAAERPGLILVWCGVIALLTGAFLPVGYGALPAYARTALRGGAVFLALYFALEPFAVPYVTLPLDHPAVLFHGHVRWAAIPLAMLGVWRPSAVFGAAMLLWMTRGLHSELTGFYFSDLDIRNVAEILTFWGIGFCFIALAARLPLSAMRLGLTGPERLRAAIMVLTAGIGAHLANYFWSGLAKLWMDGGILSWILDNRLADGIPGALEKGTLPYAASPELVQLGYDALILLQVPVNLAAFGLQIFAIAAPLRKKWLLLATIGYDIFHVAVWLALGLLFWKWIALNFIITAILVAMPETAWSRTARATTMSFVVLGMLLFRTATLAWYDSPGFTSPYFVARLADGREMRIPNAFFRSSSYQVSQGRLWWPAEAGHFRHSIWGSVLSYDDLDAGRRCEAREIALDAEPLYGPPERLAEFVRAYHRQMQPRLDEDGRLAYYLVPHHHVPSPFVADPFYAVDKRRIDTYLFRLDSVCLGIEDGRLTRRVLKRTELPLYDPQTDELLTGAD
ncbi:hypothetical protein B5C34_00555 [Pacificimonas flava]|uniref:HTTM domain-containing protein n=2 Tax=Pacificimonas TaxID=1960290 RepID=A0A219B190_9SPHN|nr:MULTISPECIES: hypothetical protein [Pacificimonas]MBZ6378298.1 hypothetical protein [Pacificimonas aurantium]OWV32090.1 hypothetical protein B5C34_00555 [Pacificimonas flava]